MAVASTVTVEFKAETAKFNNGLKKARRQAGGFGRAIGGAMKVAAAGTAIAVGALANLTRQSFKVVDAQQKVADRLGLTQAALSGLTLAAEQTGNTQRNLQLALQRSTRRIAEAAQGTGEAKKALEELGVSAQALSRLSPDEQFIRLAGAFEQVENQSDRVRLGFKLFDSEGVGLINTLKLGEEGLRGFLGEAERLGVALDRNQTAAIEEANDAVNVLKTAFRGLGNQLAVQFAPAIAKAAEALTNFIVSITQNVERIAINARALFGIQGELNNLTLQGLQQEARITGEELRRLRVFIEDLETGPRRGRRNLPDVIRRAREEAQQLQERFDAIIQRQKELISLSGGTGDGFGILEGFEPPGFDDGGLPIDPVLVQKQAQEYQAALNSVATASEKFQTRLAQIREQFATNPLFAADPELVQRLTQQAVDTYLAEINRLRSEQDRVIEEQKAQAQQLASSVATPFERLQERIIELQTLLRENPFVDAELYGKLAREAVDAYLKELERLKEGSDETFKQIGIFSEQAFRNIQDILAEFLFDPFEKGLDGMLKQFIDLLRKMIAQLLASQLLNAFFGLFGGGFVGTPTPTNVGSGGGGGFGGFRAVGGRVDPGRSFTVGERGREMFAPGSTGSVRPLGAVTVEQTNQFGGGSDLNIATLLPILEENNKKVKAEILDAFDRGSFV